jgi:hypothetical protein
MIRLFQSVLPCAAFAALGCDSCGEAEHAMRIAAQAVPRAWTSTATVLRNADDGLAATSMGKIKAPDDESTPVPAAQLSQSDQPHMEERRAVIAEYAPEILARLRKRLD